MSVACSMGYSTILSYWTALRKNRRQGRGRRVRAMKLVVVDPAEELVGRGEGGRLEEKKGAQLRKSRYHTHTCFFYTCLPGHCYKEGSP